MMTTADATPTANLTTLLRDAAVDWDVLHERHGVVLRLVERLLGVVPNCDRYLEIWPPAFRSYNVMVPNLLNLPAPIFGLGAAPPSSVGLAMYVASRTAGCAYCSAHSCSFALRRGAAPETVAAALLAPGHSLDEGERATVAVARALAAVPSSLTAAEKDDLLAAYGPAGAEAIVLSVAMMGFLNKFMDAVGVELEQDLVDEVVTTLGGDWSPGRAGAGLDASVPPRRAPRADGWRDKLELVPLLPRAISAFLLERFGDDFPVLRQLRSNRARRAIATMLREHLAADHSVLGLATTLRAAAIFAETVTNPNLAATVRNLADRAGVDLADGASGDDAALALARAASTSPARIDQATVDGCRRSGLAPDAIIELVSWLSVLQLLHRLTCWTEAPTGSRDDERIAR
jgi:alkylhydroperoxidase family enzyme